MLRYIFGMSLGGAVVYFIVVTGNLGAERFIGGLHLYFILFVTGGFSTLLAVRSCGTMLRSFAELAPCAFDAIGPNSIETLYRNILAAFVIDRDTVISSVLFGTGCALVYWAIGYSEMLATAWFPEGVYLCIFLSASGAGAGLVVLIRASMAIYTLGHCQRPRISPTFVSCYGFGKLLLQCYLWVLFVITQFQMTILIFVDGLSLADRLMSPAMMLIGYPVIACVLLLFVHLQTPFVWSIRRRKAEVTLEIEAKMDRARAAIERRDSQSLRDKHAFLQAWREEVSALPDWPTDLYRSLEAVSAAILSALLPAILAAFLS